MAPAPPLLAQIPQDYLTGVVIVFGAALLVAWIMRALRAPAILGFLLAGVLIGPGGLKLIHEGEVRFFADLGLAFLLFAVGLELSPAPLIRLGHRLVVAGLLQVLLTALVGTLLLASQPWYPMSWLSAAIIGVALALSSTAIVLKHLTDRGEVDTPAGGVITGILLMQDVFVLIVLLWLPMLGGGHGSGGRVAAHVGFALAGMVATTWIARAAMPHVVNVVFRFGGQELMTLFAVLMACLGAWLAGLAGWSWALGAFIAGLLLAQTDLRHQLQAEITPFRDTLNALFFVSIGLLVNTQVLGAHAGFLIATVLGTLVLKAVLAGGSVILAGWPLRLAVMSGIGLCTVSEFSYVLANEAARLHILSPELLDKFVVWTVGTMVLGALCIPLGNPLAARLAHILQPDRPLERGRRGVGPASLPADVGPPPPAGSPAAGTEAHPTNALASHVIIVGAGVNGRNLARVLNATRIPHVVVEMHRTTARLARQEGSEVIVGDATRMALLHSAGLPTARALVVAVADVHATRRIVAQAHVARPDLYILARTRYIAELEMLYRLGARQVIPEEFETSIEIFAHVLKEFAVPDNVVEQQVNLTRVGHYGMLRGRPADRTIRTEWLQLLEATVTQTYLLMTGSPAVGRTLADLRLRTQTGVTVVAVTRAGKPTPNPPTTFVFQTGDVLVLVGTHKQLDTAKAALEPAEEKAEGGRMKDE
jgi:CPA2 family monovalent cation:H+ antiporter-2